LFCCALYHSEATVESDIRARKIDKDNTQRFAVTYSSKEIFSNISLKGNFSKPLFSLSTNKVIENPQIDLEKSKWHTLKIRAVVA